MSYSKRWRALGAAAFAAGIVTGCGTADRTGSFRVADGSCQVHQERLPSRAYTGGVDGDTEAIMAMLASYTTHGMQPYCDGRSATATDRAWRLLYVQLGGMTKNLAG